MKTYSTKQLAVAANTTHDMILSVMNKVGVDPRSVSKYASGYTMRTWGPDAMKAAIKWREDLENKRANPKPTKLQEALNQLMPPVEEQQSSAPTTNAANDQVLHRLAVMEQKVDTAVELLAQILDHITKPGGDPASDAFKAFMTSAVGALAGKTDD